MTILFVSVLVLWLILSILEDTGYITSNSSLWHIADAWTRAVLSLYMSYMFMEVHLQTKTIWLALSIALAINVGWWILFDLGINIARRMPLFYIGSSGIDKFFKKYSKKFDVNPIDSMLITKSILVLLCNILLAYTL